MAPRNKGELCHLHWTDHESLLRGVCNNLLTTEKFADVTLFCDGVGIKCHKFILSACSTYFDQIFSESPCSHPVIILKDVSYWQMQALLQFIYKGELNTDEAKLGSLVELAQSLQIKGIGEFRTAPEETNTPTAEQKQKKSSISSQNTNSAKNMKEYLSVEDHTNTISGRLVALPKESRDLLENSLSVPLDASDFSLQETEVEYSFESDPLGDSQHMTSAMHESILEYPEETSTDPGPPKKRCARSNYATDSDADATSDASVTVSVTATPVYKRYTDEQLSGAIKAVVEEGMKQVDACIKYGIPFTTLTRKLSIYRAGGDCLISATSKKKNRPHSSKLSVASILSIENDFDSTANIENVSDERVVLVIEDSLDALPSEMESKHVPSFKHYKTYSENNLKAAISAVLHNGMRMQEASKYYKIPMSTLSRKIRSHKPNDQPHLQTMSFDVHSN